jgi:hypothetical protein
VLSKSVLFSVCFFAFFFFVLFFCKFFFIAVVFVCRSLIGRRRRRRWQPCGLLAVEAADVAQEDAVDVLVSFPFVVVVVVVIVCGRWSMIFFFFF